MRLLAGRPKDEASFTSVCETLASPLHYYDDDPKWGPWRWSYWGDIRQIIDRAFACVREL
ncbi:MAG TPA: hypothetical protein VGP07_19805 [Polyangia bacterium]